ncbi:MAG: alpha/beta hydrolase [Verrucomicrobia bacterium]|nr:alpha/beta hydrolase [Verrucomicrobiota bacterium]
MKKFIQMLLRCLMWAALSIVIFLVSCQSKLIYYPRPYGNAELESISKLGGKRIEVTTSQGRQVAFYLPSRQAPSQPPEFLWLVFGGNGARAMDYSSEAAGWDARFGYLFMDYPGYGLCEGSPNPDRIEESIVALTSKLQGDLHWSDAQFRARSGIFGHSLGCAAGLIAMDRFQLKSGVICAPFTTMTDMAKRVLGWPLCYLNRHRFDNIARLTAIAPRGAQVRIFHGQDDDSIRVTMSQKLAAMFPQTVRLTVVPDSGHNDVVPAASVEIGKAMRQLAGFTP